MKRSHGLQALAPMESLAVSEMKTWIRQLRIEKEFKKSSNLLRKHANITENTVRIDAQMAKYLSFWICQMLHGSRSSIYAWLGNVKSAATTRTGDLVTLLNADSEDALYNIQVLANHGDATAKPLSKTLNWRQI